MKSLKKLLALLFCLCLIAGLSATAFADNYTYTVRVYAGAQGSFGSGDAKVYTVTRGYGDTFSFNAQSAVTLPADSKYYVKGIRESGKDNNTVSNSAFYVTHDVDYVVAYGMKGSEVSYTVRYVTYPGGATLAPSRTFYGNAGDKPVIAYEYIEGYTPRYLNLTGTLSENAANNVFTFEYVPQTTTTTTTDTTAGGNNNNNNNNAAGNNANANNNAAGNNANAGNNAAGNNANAGNNAAGNDNANAGNNAAGNDNANAGNQDAQANAGGELTENPAEVTENILENGPEEILDLDVPLAGPDFGGAGTENGSDTSSQTSSKRISRLALVLGIIVAAGIVCTVLWYLLFARRRKEKDED